jgi:streptomycin 6-kinase
MGSSVPSVDVAARQRLTARFGSDVQPWLDRLPAMLSDLAEKWQLQLGAQIPRGSMSVVFHCQTADGRGAVLKASPDRVRLALEAEALSGWHTQHTPAVLALDEHLGALLLDAVEPGTPLAVSPALPAPEHVAELLDALHEPVGRDLAYPTVGERTEYLFDASLKLYQRHPELSAVISRSLYERGRRLAGRLAANPVPAVLLHGDLTPSNVLDGGARRGLVAIDPAPCVGDPAFDAVDLLLWRADDFGTIRARVERLSARSGIDSDRLLGWCIAFAGMSALELASLGDGHGRRIEALALLAAQAPTHER